MAVDPANAHELTRTASKTGVDALTGHLRDPSETAGRQPGDPHFREHLDRCRDQPMRLMTVPVCQAVPATWACGICDLLFSRRGECLREGQRVAIALAVPWFHTIIDPDSRQPPVAAGFVADISSESALVG